MIFPLNTDLGSAAWTSILAALLGGGAVATINGILLRPKTNAEARQTHVTADVSVSADSRQWVDQAMGRATRAEERLDEVEDENDELRSRFNALVDYILRMHREWGSDHPPPMPAELTLPLLPPPNRRTPPPPAPV